MAGRYFEDAGGWDVNLFAGVQDHMHRSGDRIAKVMELTAGGTRDGRHVRRPAPAGLVHGMADRGLANRQYLCAASWERPDIVGIGECLVLKAWHINSPTDRGGLQARRAASGQAVDTHLGVGRCHLNCRPTLPRTALVDIALSHAVIRPRDGTRDRCCPHRDGGDKHQTDGSPQSVGLTGRLQGRPRWK